MRVGEKSYNAALFVLVWFFTYKK